MNEDSKKRNHLKKKLKDLVRGFQMAELPLVEKAAEFLRYPKRYELVEKVATFPKENNPEMQRFIICFDYFNWNTCNWDQFDSTKGKKLIQILEQVAKCTMDKFPELKLGRDSVMKTKEYESLFRTVSPEVSKINETELCGGRVFYFITEPRFNLVSVETKHRNIDN